MPDDKPKGVPKDRDLIDLNDPDEVRYWCGRFQCTANELREAVYAVGPSRWKVEKQLREKRKRPQEPESPGGL